MRMMNKVSLPVVHRAITRHLLGQAGLKPDEANSGIQRFGSAANLKVHPRCLVLDGVYRCSADGAPSFVEVDAPTDDELHTMWQSLITRLMKLLTRRGVLVEKMGQTYLAEPDADADADADADEARTLRPRQAAAVTYRIAFGPRAGQKVRMLQGAMPRETAFKQTLCAAAPMTARRWNNCAATSRARHWQTSACRPTPPDKWCSSSRQTGFGSAVPQGRPASLHRKTGRLGS